MSHSTGGGHITRGGGGHMTAPTGRWNTPGVGADNPIWAAGPQSGRVLKSKLAMIGPVPFPDFTGERVYMLPFIQIEGLPPALSRWQPTVDAMLTGILCPPPGKIYLMIDQGRVTAGQTQRRPGPHIDGNWIEDLSTADHATGRAMYPETLILASNVEGCQAWTGAYFDKIGKGGDCTAVDTSHMRLVRMKAGIAYAGNVTMIHESIPIPHDCERTLVRLNVPHHQL